MARSRFAGLQWGEEKGWKRKESRIYLVGGILGNASSCNEALMWPWALHAGQATI